MKRNLGIDDFKKPTVSKDIKKPKEEKTIPFNEFESDIFYTLFEFITFKQWKNMLTAYGTTPYRFGDKNIEILKILTSKNIVGKLKFKILLDGTKREYFSYYKHVENLEIILDRNFMVNKDWKKYFNDTSGDLSIFESVKVLKLTCKDDPNYYFDEDNFDEIRHTDFANGPNYDVKPLKLRINIPNLIKNIGHKCKTIETLVIENFKLCEDIKEKYEVGLFVQYDYKANVAKSMDFPLEEYVNLKHIKLINTSGYFNFSNESKTKLETYEYDNNFSLTQQYLYPHIELDTICVKKVGVSDKAFFPTYDCNVFQTEGCKSIKCIYNDTVIHINKIIMKCDYVLISIDMMFVDADEIIIIFPNTPDKINAKKIVDNLKTYIQNTTPVTIMFE